MYNLFSQTWEGRLVRDVQASCAATAATELATTWTTAVWAVSAASSAASSTSTPVTASASQRSGIDESVVDFDNSLLIPVLNLLLL